MSPLLGPHHQSPGGCRCHRSQRRPSHSHCSGNSEHNLAAVCRDSTRCFMNWKMTSSTDIMEVLKTVRVATVEAGTGLVWSGLVWWRLSISQLGGSGTTRSQFQSHGERSGLFVKIRHLGILTHTKKGTIRVLLRQRWNNVICQSSDALQVLPENDLESREGPESENTRVIFPR